MSVTVAFGPGDRFLIDTPKRWTWHNLPFAFDSSARELLAVAFGPRDGYYMLQRNAKGIQVKSKNDSFDRQYPKLAQWLDDKRFPQVVAAPIDFGISLGPNGSFWARRGDACRWHNVASSLDDWLQVAIGLGLQGIQVSLGVYGSYITYAPSQNETQWVLNACYPTLEKILDDWLASPPGSAGDMGGRIICRVPVLACFEKNDAKVEEFMTIYETDGSFRILAQRLPLRRPSHANEIGEAVELVSNVGEFAVNVTDAVTNCVLQ